MNQAAFPTVLILASGRGLRFMAAGGRSHKLQALLGGVSVLERTLESVRASGLPLHMEQSGRHAGMGDSLAAAVRATPDACGWLILPADMPLVLPATLLAVAAALQCGASAAQPVREGQRGHPVGFGAQHHGELVALKGDQGARSLLSGLRTSAKAIDVPTADPGILLDIDTPQDLERAEALWLARESLNA